MEPGSGIEGILDLHKKVAVRYKEYETADGEIPPLVVLNEMRYALRATVKILQQASFSHLSNEERKILNVSVQEANHALRNAYHDLVDGILIQISRLMDSLLEKYPVAAANVLKEKRLDILRDINEVEARIAESRGDGLKRQKLYETEIYEKWFATIVDHYRFVDQVAYLEIIREHDRITSNEKKLERRHQTLVLLAVLAIAVSIAIAIFNAKPSDKATTSAPSTSQAPHQLPPGDTAKPQA